MVVFFIIRRKRSEMILEKFDVIRRMVWELIFFKCFIIKILTHLFVLSDVVSQNICSRRAI
jgi:hypothetical protein